MKTLVQRHLHSYATAPPQGLHGKGIIGGRVTFPDDQRSDAFQQEGETGHG